MRFIKDIDFDMQKIKVFEAFSGIGAQAMACKRLQKMFPDKVEFEFVGISEIAPDACAAYKAVHGDIPNYGDISKIDWAQVPDFDLFTWSSPCQDFSQAGKQAGAIEGSGTRSSLLWECFRAFEVKRPKYLLFENVAAVLSRKFKPMFLQVVDRLGSLGYTNFWQVLDAKGYGAPQHRERVFMVSILGDKATFEFPKPFPLEKRLRDVLEDNVPESYYLKDEQVAKILEHSERKQAQGCGFKYNCGGGDREPKILIVGNYSPTSACNGKVLDANGICPTLLDHKGAEPAVIEIVSCAIRGCNPGNPSDRRAGMPTEQRLELGGDVANCLTSVQKDSMVAETCIFGYTRDSMGNIQNYHERDIAGTIHTSTGSGGNTDQFVKEMIIQNAHGYNKGGLFEDISPTVTSSAFQNNNFVIKKDRIRRLTEREVFRLMGMDDADIDKIDAYRVQQTLKNGKVKEKPISKSAKYRMAGNSIVIDCLYHIFYQMFIAKPPKPQPKQLTLFD